MNSRLLSHVEELLGRTRAYHNAVGEGGGAPRVLDVACGDGSFTQILHEALPEYEIIIAVDVDPSLLEQGEDRFAETYPGREPSVRFVRGDAQRLSFMNTAFDVVTISNALHHVANVPETLAEILRVTKPGGAVLIHEMVSDRLSAPQQVARDLHHFKARIDRLYGVSHRPSYTRAELSAFLEELPAKIVARVSYDPGGSGDEGEDIEDRVEFVETYAELAADLPSYAAIRKEATRLIHRLRSIGFAYPTQELIALTAASSTGSRAAGGSP